MKNKILDYEQVLEKLKSIKQSSNIIKKEKPIGITSYGLPILHYTCGSGKNHVVLSAVQHGCEIVTTNFLIELMVQISQKNQKFEFLNGNDYTLHFLPMLNPEGYLIVTSALRKVIGRELPDDEAHDVYLDYLEAYRQDDHNCKLGLSTNLKYHQQYFGHIEPEIILNKKYENVRKNIQKFFESKKIPAGTLVTWHANANGVDLNQNTPYNPKIEAIRNGEHKYSLYRYDNIETTIPGPIGYPTKHKDFEYEEENKALLKFLLELKNNKNINLCAFFNYHSTGGLVYYKPYAEYKNLKEPYVMSHMEIEKIYNKKIAELYSSKTNYKLVENEPSLACFNDLIRLQIPGDMLIELSVTSGNPLGPLIDETYNKTIEDNIEALSFTIPKLKKMNEIKMEFIKKIESRKICEDINER